MADISFRLIPHVDEVNALMEEIAVNTELSFPLDATAFDARFYKRLDGIKAIRVSYRDYGIVEEMRLVDQLAIDLSNLPDYVITDESVNKFANTVKKLKLLDELIIYCNNAPSGFVAKLKKMFAGEVRYEPTFIAA